VPPDRLDQHLFLPAGEGVEGEEDPGRLRRYLLLDEDRHPDPTRVQAAPGGVGTGPLAPGGGPAGADRRQEGGEPIRPLPCHDVQDGVVLAGEGDLRQVLGGGGGADGEGGRKDGARLLQCPHHLGGHCCLPQRGGVGIGAGGDVGLQEGPVGVGGEAEGRGDRQPGAGHLGQPERLAPHAGSVVVADLGQRKGVAFHSL
jgi:hypothetical protein